jgi:hypothetical protein
MWIDAQSHAQEDSSCLWAVLESCLAGAVRWPVRFECDESATAIRLQLLDKVRERNWRKLSVDEIGPFLIFLFGENPGRTGNGITVRREEGRWRISFKGVVEFGHELFNGQPLWHAVTKVAAQLNRDVKRRIRQSVAPTR